MSAGIDGFNPSFPAVGGGVTGSRYSCSKKEVFAMAEYLLGVAILSIRLTSALIDMITCWRSLKREEAPHYRRPAR
jgi:hypothetical protein